MKDHPYEESIMSTTDTAHAKKIDTELSRMITDLHALGQRLEHAENRVYTRGQARRIGHRGGAWDKSLDEAIERLEKFPEESEIGGKTNAQVLEDYFRLKDQVQSENWKFRAYESEHYTGWQRFYIVQGGHIHGSRECHTLRATTRVGWLPNLSGESEQDAVNEHGPLLCTVCFPSAPVEWTIGVKKDDDGKCSSQNLVEGSFKRRYPSNYGICAECGSHVTVHPTSGRVRKHKKGDEQ